MSNVVYFPERRDGADPEPLWRESVGAELRAQRHERGERITDVARRAGIAPQYLSEVERGRKDPSSEVLAAVAGALEVPLADLTSRAAQRLGSAPTCLAA
ncbi:MAG: helix-turn-helix domain-containing protein [Cumulibacter sp.]